MTMGRYIVGIDTGLQIAIDRNQPGARPTTRPIHMESPDEIDRRYDRVKQEIEQILQIHGGTVTPVTKTDLSVETTDKGIEEIRQIQYVASINPGRNDIRPNGLRLG